MLMKFIISMIASFLEMEVIVRLSVRNFEPLLYEGSKFSKMLKTKQIKMQSPPQRSSLKLSQYSSNAHEIHHFNDRIVFGNGGHS